MGGIGRIPESEMRRLLGEEVKRVVDPPRPKRVRFHGYDRVLH